MENGGKKENDRLAFLRIYLKMFGQTSQRKQLGVINASLLLQTTAPVENNIFQVL